MKIVNSSATSALATSDANYWSALPRELRDMIMRLAYHRDDFEGFILQNAWEVKQDQARKSARNHRSTFTPMVFEHYVDRFMVSKQWLPEAAQGFFSSLHCVSAETNYIFNMGTPQYRNDPFLGLEYLTSLEIENAALVNCAAQIAQVCTRLKILKVHMDHIDLEKMFDDRDDLCVWYDSWTVDLLQDSHWFHHVSALSGLKDASLSFDRVIYRRHNYEETRTCRANSRLMGLVFYRSATRPRSTPAPGPTPPPGLLPSRPIDLFPESKIDSATMREHCLTLMKLHPNESAMWMAQARRQLTGMTDAAAPTSQPHTRTRPRRRRRRRIEPPRPQPASQDTITAMQDQDNRSSSRLYISKRVAAMASLAFFVVLMILIDLWWGKSPASVKWLRYY